jgi:pimeloyl-ACP methyl ester carboxylesterase
LGTPVYMAPEQAAADPQVDHRADIYALGAMAYELLTGEPPFTGASNQEVMIAHMMRPAEPISSRQSSIPVALEQVVMRCLEKRPEDRWQTAEELLGRFEMLLAANPASLLAVVRAAEPVAQTFRLTEDVCRKLNRATLDPRIIGGSLHYLDNRVESPVLLCLLHGAGLSAEQFLPHLQRYRYRALAPTLVGFEPESAERIPLTLADQVILLREFLSDAIRRFRPPTVVLVGVSSGGDLGFHLLTGEPDPGIAIDGFISLGCNLTLETCFVSGIFANIRADNPDEIVQALQHLSARVSRFDEWVTLNDYLVQILRKFRSDIEPLRRFSKDVVAPFTQGGEYPFYSWFRTASLRVRTLRCVFEDTNMYRGPLREIRLRNLDQAVLGPRYREDSLIVEPNTDHFDLFQPDLIARHVEALIGELHG